MSSTVSRQQVHQQEQSEDFVVSLLHTINTFIHNAFAVKSVSHQPNTLEKSTRPYPDKYYTPRGRLNAAGMTDASPYSTASSGGYRGMYMNISNTRQTTLPEELKHRAPTSFGEKLLSSPEYQYSFKLRKNWNEYASEGKLGSGLVPVMKESYQQGPVVSAKTLLTLNGEQLSSRDVIDGKEKKWVQRTRIL